MSIVKYLKEKILYLVLYLLIFAMLVGSFSLYELPAEAVVYPMGLGLLLLMAFLAVDYRSERRKFKRVQELEQQITELKQSIVDEQARTSQRMDYINVWTHQIKTPIAAMGLALENEDSDLGRRLRAELTRIEAYVDMVMTYLRLDSESTDYVFEEKDLDEIIRGAVRKFSGEFIARKISLDYEPVGVKVLTDEKWLSFVIEQVLSNALKYTPSGSISIYTENSEILCIRDTGIGIAPEDLPRIFEQGFTGYNGRTSGEPAHGKFASRMGRPTSRNKFGTIASGIGLYLCKRICDGLGYQIWAESEVGKGTVIRLNLAK